MKQTWAKISTMPDREMLKAPSLERATSVLLMERIGPCYTEMVYVLDGKNMGNNSQNLFEMEPGYQELWPKDPEELKKRYLEIWVQERALAGRLNIPLEGPDLTDPEFRDSGSTCSDDDFTHEDEAPENELLPQDEALEVLSDIDDPEETCWPHLPGYGPEPEPETDEEEPSTDEHFNWTYYLRAAERALRVQGIEPPKTIDGWNKLYEVYKKDPSVLKSALRIDLRVFPYAGMNESLPTIRPV
jgi:hypothetical protein